MRIEDVEFVDINLPCNKLRIQLLINDFIVRLKKRRVVFKIEKKVDKSLKIKATQKKNILQAN